MEEEVLSENIVEVAEPQEEQVETTNAENSEVVETSNVETPINNGRDYEKDSAFATMRKSMEQYRKDFEKAKAENERLTKAFGLYGFTGKDTDEVLDQANAHYYGKTVEEVREQRLAQAQKEAEENELRERIKYYEQKEIEDKMKQDLSDIQKYNPDIKSINEMPKEYFDLIRKGVSGLKAYKLLELDGLFGAATQRAEQEAVKKIQATTKAGVGSVSGGTVEKVSYANMSDAEFEKLIQKVKRGEMTAI